MLPQLHPSTLESDKVQLVLKIPSGENKYSNLLFKNEDMFLEVPQGLVFGPASTLSCCSTF